MTRKEKAEVIKMHEKSVRRRDLRQDNTINRTELVRNGLETSQFEFTELSDDIFIVLAGIVKWQEVVVDLSFCADYIEGIAPLHWFVLEYQ